MIDPRASSRQPGRMWQLGCIEPGKIRKSAEARSDY
jgi:hypothetical protein